MVHETIHEPSRTNVRHSRIRRGPLRGPQTEHNLEIAYGGSQMIGEELFPIATTWKRVRKWVGERTLEARGPWTIQRICLFPPYMSEGPTSPPSSHEGMTQQLINCPHSETVPIKWLGNCLHSLFFELSHMGVNSNQVKPHWTFPITAYRQEKGSSSWSNWNADTFVCVLYSAAADCHGRPFGIWYICRYCSKLVLNFWVVLLEPKIPHGLPVWCFLCRIKIIDFSMSCLFTFILWFRFPHCLTLYVIYKKIKGFPP